MKNHMKGRIRVCVCEFGPGSTIKHARLHQLSAYISPGLQTLTRHFSHNLGDKDISVLNTLNTHTHTHTLLFRHVRKVIVIKEKKGMM